jgi:primase-polymerase (primpol)-like protein
MREAKRWLLWKRIDTRKVPFYASGEPRKGTLDAPKDLARLVTFEDAAQAYKRGDWAGLGFALGPDGNGGCWQGIDFDHLSEHPELQALVESLPGYVERSPSGDGVHAIGYGQSFETLAQNGSGIEAYSKARFFTVTGDVWGCET